MMYRRRLKSDVWHFVTSCRWWPKRGGFFSDRFRKGTDYMEKATKPKSGELCNECISKAKRKAVKK